MKRWKSVKNLWAICAVKASRNNPWSTTNLIGTSINSRMSDRFQSRYSSTRLSILLAALGVCVFFWGLGYKLSLYERQPARIHQIPQAKLLSHNEDRSAAEGILLCLSTSRSCHPVNLYTQFLIWLLGGAGLCVRRDWRCFSAKRPWCQSLDILLDAFYFRPPPVFCPQ